MRVANAAERTRRQRLYSDAKQRQTPLHTAALHTAALHTARLFTLRGSSHCAALHTARRASRLASDLEGDAAASSEPQRRVKRQTLHSKTKRQEPVPVTNCTEIAVACPGCTGLYAHEVRPEIKHKNTQAQYRGRGVRACLEPESLRALPRVSSVVKPACQHGGQTRVSAR
eukprot:1829306-Rhodomonas_salina.1